MKRTAICIALCAVFLCAFPASASAVDFSVDAQTGYGFSAEDFQTVNGTPQGIYIVSVPDESVGSISLGSRSLHSGDILSSAVFGQLQLQSAGNQTAEAEMTFRPISGNRVGDTQTMRFFFREKKNLPPTARDSTLETYRNVVNQGTLDVTDEHPDTLTFSLVKPPKRGTVEFGENATFTYTPIKNKVGTDSFIYTACDSSGNVSEPATVTVTILKPADKAAFSDMDGDSDAFTALWMKEQKLFGGESVLNRLCFCPEKEVTRSEFLCMTLHLCGNDGENTPYTAGFVDTEASPKWMQTYLVSALRSGIVTGNRTEQGMVFRPQESITKAEAAVMLKNALQLTATQPVSISSGSLLPAWAEKSVLALADAGVRLSVTDTEEPLTRRDCARLLYQIAELLAKRQQPSAQA